MQGTRYNQVPIAAIEQWRVVLFNNLIDTGWFHTVVVFNFGRNVPESYIQEKLFYARPTAAYFAPEWAG